MYTDLTFSPHTSFGMGIKLALNFIWNGIKKALKSLEFHLEDPGGTLEEKMPMMFGTSNKHHQNLSNVDFELQNNQELSFCYILLAPFAI